MLTKLLSADIIICFSKHVNNFIPVHVLFSLTFNFFPDEENRLKKNQFEKENATIYHGKILNQESQDFQVIAFHLEKNDDKSIKILFRMNSPVDPESIKNAALYLNDKRVTGPSRFSKDGCKMSFLISGVKFKKEKDFSSFNNDKAKQFVAIKRKRFVVTELLLLKCGNYLKRASPKAANIHNRW